MAIVFDGSNTKYGSLPNTSYFHRTMNCAVAVWFKPAGGVTQQFIMGEDQNAGGSTRYTGFAYRGNSSGQVSLVRASVETHHDLGSPVLNDWNVAAFSRPNSAIAVSTPSALNGTDSSPSTLINQDFELVRLILGARRIAGGSAYTDLFNGQVGAWAVWNRTLTTEEINSLQSGAHPNTISSGLVDWMVITGSGTATTLSTNAGTTMTFVGSPTLNADTPFINISAVNGGSDTAAYGEVCTWTTSGFSPAPNAASVAGVACSSVSGSGFTMPGLVDGATVPLPGARQLTGTNGTQSANRNITVTTPEGMTAQLLSGELDTEGPGSVLINLDPPAEPDDYIVHPTAGNTEVDSAGRLKTDLNGYIEMWHIQASTGISRLLPVITGAPVGIVTSLSSIGIVSRGIRATGI